MDWVQRMNDAIDDIEANLTGSIDYARLGQLAGCSSYHFQRLFAYMAGVPLSEYIRRRRMSLAAVALQNGGKIIDVAALFGYASPTAFNRAFQSVHGLPPSAVKREGVPVKSFPPISFKITIQGVEAMQYRIETKDAFQIVGVSVPLSKDMEENFSTLPAKWAEVSTNGTLQALLGMMDRQPMGVLGVNFCPNDEPWRYYIAVASSQTPEGWACRTVPAATWAIFSGSGPHFSIQELERQILTQWLPTSGYAYGDAPDLEVYLDPNPENARYEVWIPVVKK
ncbi:MAG: AraC family transcriptional regulator [Ruminiclostridium sp.]|jgi:AraC family transcriptional regulator|nr:AraC family transcriptional regulator [Ruminiclostridium sp.]